MNETQTMHAMGLDDAYHVEQTLARGTYGVTELVSLDGAGPFVRKKIPSGLVRRDVWAALGECRNPRLPHVEATYELPDRFVVVFDYVAGATLAQRIETQGRMGPDEAVAVAMQLCDAVSELHARGVVHRDITPKNVILAADGAHLIDFGIARMRDDAASRDTTALGTWGFASPEQFGFTQTDARSDVYSIGRLLGFMLTGLYPDEAAYERALADARVVPPVLRDIIANACAFEPSARQSSANRLGCELAAWRQGGLPPEQPNGNISGIAAHTRTARGSVGKSSRNRKVIVAVAAVVLSVALVAGLIWGFAAVKGPFRNTQEAGNDTGSSSSAAPRNEDKIPGADNGDDASAPKTRDTGNNAVDAAGPLELVESGWSAEDGYVQYALGLKNTSETHQVNFPKVTIVGRAKNGSVVFTYDTVLSVAFPGQTIYDAGLAGNGTAPDDVEFRLSEPDDTDMVQSTGAYSFQTKNLSSNTNDFGDTTFTGEITGEATGDPKILGGASQVKVSIVLRDGKGRIVYGEMGFVDMPRDGRSVPFSINIMSNIPEYETYEAYAMAWL